jgi:speckle-type POZ protein
MENSCANLTGAVRLVRLIKVEGFSAKVDNNDCIKSAWSVDGYDWEIRVYPAKIMFAAREFDRMWVVVELVSINKLRICKAVLVCRLVDPSGNLEPTKENSLFYDPDCKNYVWLMRRKELAPGYLMDDTLTMQCAITVLKELPEPAITAEDVGTPAPSYTFVGKTGHTG